MPVDSLLHSGYARSQWRDRVHAVPRGTVQHHGERAAVYFVPLGNVQREDGRQQQRCVRSMPDRHVRGRRGRDVRGRVHCLSCRDVQPVKWLDDKRSVSAVPPRDVQRNRRRIIAVAVCGMRSRFIHCVPRGVGLRRVSRGNIQRGGRSAIVACMLGVPCRNVEQRYWGGLSWSLHRVPARDVWRCSRLGIVLGLRSGTLLRVCRRNHLSALPVWNVQSKQKRKQLTLVHELSGWNVRLKCRCQDHHRLHTLCSW